MSYAELCIQSCFSFLTGASHPEELAATAAFLNYSAIAITDECSVAGVVRAHQYIKANHLPLTLLVGSRFNLGDSLRLVALCPSKTAYAELCRVITNARKRAPKGNYSLAEWDLKTMRHCLFLWLPKCQTREDDHWAQWLIHHYPERCWIGAERQLDGKDHERFSCYQRLQQEYGLPVVATGNVLFHQPQRQPLQQVLTAIKHNTQVSKLGLDALSNQERCLRPLHKLVKLFPVAWLEQSLVIAQQCQFSLDELRYQYPSELIPSGKTASEYLRECVEAGIIKRFGGEPPSDIRAIIEKELVLIKEQQYEYFFLTIYDIVQFAKRQGILYQGRGSAANSVVCYCLEITAVDPRQINVLFERFISKERNEPPDIDVDFEHERREEIIQYIYRKYGRERTALAATVITFRFKSALREVGKALGFAESRLDYLIKQVNRRDRDLPWQEQLYSSGLDASSTLTKQLISLVETIMGMPRHLSQHVGGFVISSGPLYELVPVENAAMPERTVIQWDKDDLESLGLLKVDVLALGMLTAIRKMFALIEQDYGYKLSIPWITRLGDDRQVYAQISEADTVGVFQIESRAQMSMLPRLKPNTYYDLVIQIAIVRPGPIQGDMVHPYLLRRHGKETITYPSKEVEQVLSRTMGVPIFQEQVIQLAMVAAGFSGGEADQLRRAMASWKKNGQLHGFRQKLIEGMQQRGYAVEFAERIFEQILGFGEYGFPESHSASFAVLAYVSAWIKRYFPTQFYAALLNSLPMGFYSASQLLQDAKRHDIALLPVCVNHSSYDYTTVRQHGQFSIRLGLRQIKGLSQEHAELAIVKRPQQGYQTIAQLRQRLMHQKALQALASSGALASLSGNRFEAQWKLLDNQVELPLFAEEHEVTQQSRAPAPIEELIEDFSSLSLSIQHHPIALLAQHHNLTGYTFAQQLNQHPHKQWVKVIGCVTGKQAPGTASGVTFITLEDHTGNCNLVVWQATARAQIRQYLSARILEVHGILERSEEDVIHVIAGKLIDRSNWLEPLLIKSRDFH